MLDFIQNHVIEMFKTITYTNVENKHLWILWNTFPILCVRNQKLSNKKNNNNKVGTSFDFIRLTLINLIESVYGLQSLFGDMIMDPVPSMIYH